MIEMLVGGSMCNQRQSVCGALLALVLVCVAACGYETAEPERPAVAVLPCEDLSPDPDDAYLAAGLHEEILLKLANISGLISIGRTSVEYFRDNPAPVEEMAAKLGVGFVGECSVRKAPEEKKIRLTFQLLQPTGAQVWAESYDAELTAGSLLETESEVAQRVASAIGATLTPDEQARVQEKPTEDAQAYELYLRARRSMMLRPAAGDYRNIAQLLQKATELDPGFAEAHAALAYAHFQLHWFRWDRSPERLELARESLERAASLKPNAPEVHRLRGVSFVRDGDYDRGLEEYNLSLQARVEAPTLALKSAALRFQGKYEEALSVQREAVRLDPLSATWAHTTGITLTGLRRFAEAEREFERARALGPGQPVVYGGLFALFICQGDTKRARAVLEAAEQAGVRSGALQFDWFRLETMERDYEAALSRLSAPSWRSYNLPKTLLRGELYSLQGDDVRARANFDSALVDVEERIRENPNDPDLTLSLGYVYAGLGRKADAVRQADRAVDLLPMEKNALDGYAVLRDAAEVYAQAGALDGAIDRLEILLSRPGRVTAPELRLNPVWDPLREHARFQALLEKYEQ